MAKDKLIDIKKYADCASLGEEAHRAAQAGIDALRNDPNVDPMFRAALPEIFGIPLMQGDLGAVIDKVNQKLQVLMSMFHGNERGENLVDEVAKLLREYYRQEHAEDLAGRYVATATTIRLNSDVIGRMRSHSMAKRAARALNHYKPNRKGE